MRQLKIGQRIAIRDASSLARYLKEAKRCRLLSHEEEITLSIKSRAGDLVAQNELVTANLLFVVSVAKNYQNSGMTLNDLINEGNIGLIKASKDFDSSRGFRFITYAIWPIRQAILYAISDQQRMVRLPQNMISVLAKISKCSTKLQQFLERNPTAAEIAEHINVSENKIIEYLNDSRHTLSLDAKNIESDTSLLDIIEEVDFSMEYFSETESSKVQVKTVMKSLSYVAKNVLSLHFGLNGEDPMKLEDIAILFNLSKERIRQIKDNAIKKMRNRSCVLMSNLAEL
jgi:RNA polymerase primary sigma factor